MKRFEAKQKAKAKKRAAHKGIPHAPMEEECAAVAPCIAPVPLVATAMPNLVVKSVHLPEAVAEAMLAKQEDLAAAKAARSLLAALEPTRRRRKLPGCSCTSAYMQLATQWVWGHCLHCCRLLLQRRRFYPNCQSRVRHPAQPQHQRFPASLHHGRARGESA